MKRFAITALSAALLALGSAPAALGADFVMKLSSPAPLNDKDALSAWFYAFEKGVEASSEGRIDVQIFPSSQLGPIPATVEGVAFGTIEATFPIIGFFSKLDPRFAVLDAAGLFDDEAHAMRALSDPTVKAMLAEYGAGANVEPLVIVTSGQSVVVSKEPISSTADFSGIKLRTGGATPLLNTPMKDIGATPVAMPLGEALPGIQTGTIDAATINMPVAIGFKFADVAKHANYLPGSFTVVGGVVNKDFLRTIGPDLEAIVRNEAEKAKAAYAEKIDSGQAFFEALWTKQGGVLNTLKDADAYATAVGESIAKVVADNPQMQADFDILMQAAASAR